MENDLELDAIKEWAASDSAADLVSGDVTYSPQDVVREVEAKSQIGNELRDAMRAFLQKM